MKFTLPGILVSRLKFSFDGKENCQNNYKIGEVNKAFWYDSFCTLFNA